MRNSDVALVSLFAAIGIAAFAYWAVATSDCEARGGVLVRPAIGLGFECVERR